jgi:D-alanyl-D-alanine carboxypeptidase
VTLKSFWQFLTSKSSRKINWLLIFLIFCLIPATNYYYDLDLSSSKPLIKAIAYEEKPLFDYPVKTTQVVAPQLSALSAMVVDADTQAILMTKNADEPLPPASTTKIMTALVALDYYDLGQVLTIDKPHLSGQVMELEEGEKITVENLLYGLLVQSGNDAAKALADYYPGGEEAFVKAMNQKAQDLGLQNTQFKNPTGLDQFGHYTSVHDLVLLAAAAMRQPTFAKMVGTPAITVTDVDNTIVHELETLNDVLGVVEGLSGVKTGWTELAGECLVTYVERDGRAIITVVLASSDRFGESATLIDWVYQNFNWQAVPESSLQ